MGWLWHWFHFKSVKLHKKRDSDEDDYQDRDYDVAALANNLSQAFRYGIYNNEDIEEVHSFPGITCLSAAECSFCSVIFDSSEQKNRNIWNFSEIDEGVFINLILPT